MGRPRILDQRIMSKIAKKTGRTDITAINNMVSKRAKKLRISPEAALVILATEHDVGTAIYQRSLDEGKQAEIRYALSAVPTPNVSTLNSGKNINQNKKEMIKKTTSRLPWLTLSPNLYGIGFDMKKIKPLDKWFGKK